MGRKHDPALKLRTSCLQGECLRPITWMSNAGRDSPGSSPADHVLRPVSNMGPLAYGASAQTMAQTRDPSLKELVLKPDYEHLPCKRRVQPYLTPRLVSEGSQVRAPGRTFASLKIDTRIESLSEHSPCKRQILDKTLGQIRRIPGKRRILGSSPGLSIRPVSEGSWVGLSRALIFLHSFLEFRPGLKPCRNKFLLGRRVFKPSLGPGTCR